MLAFLLLGTVVNAALPGLTGRMALQADDDGLVQIGQVESCTMGMPLYLNNTAAYTNSESVSLYTAAQLEGLNAGDKIKSITFKGYSNESYQNYTDIPVEMYLMNTNDETDAIDYDYYTPNEVFSTVGMTQVFNGIITLTRGGSGADDMVDVMKVEFSSPFEYDGGALRIVTRMVNNDEQGTGPGRFLLARTTDRKSRVRSKATTAGLDGLGSSLGYHPVMWVELAQEEEEVLHEGVQVLEPTTEMTCTAGNPIWQFKAFSESENIYTASELESAGIPQGAKIKSITFQGYRGKNANEATSTVNMWVGSVDGETTNEANTDGLTQVVTNQVITLEANTSGSNTATGDLMTITFDTPYTYDGKDLKMVLKSVNDPKETSSYTRFLREATKKNNHGTYRGYDDESAPGSFSANAYRPILFVTYAESATPTKKHQLTLGDYEAASSLRVGEEYVVTVTATNATDDDVEADSYEPKLYIDGEVFSTAEAVAVTAGATANYTFTYTPEATGNHTAKIAFEGLDKKTESTEWSFKVKQAKEEGDIWVLDDNSSDRRPINTYYTHSRTETVYTADKIDVESGQQLTSLSFLSYATSDLQAPSTIKIFIEETEDGIDFEPNTVALSNMTKVYDVTSTITAHGSNGVPTYEKYITADLTTLDAPFIYHGGNLRVIVCCDINGTNNVNIYFANDETYKGTRFGNSNAYDNIPAEEIEVGSGAYTIMPSPVLVLTAQDNTPLLGDANGDGEVDMNDYVTVVSYILEEEPSPFVFENADVNGDGEIDMNDYVGIIDIILNQE